MRNHHRQSRRPRRARLHTGHRRGGPHHRAARTQRAIALHRGDRARHRAVSRCPRAALASPSPTPLARCSSPAISQPSRCASMPAKRRPAQPTARASPPSAMSGCWTTSAPAQALRDATLLGLDAAARSSRGSPRARRPASQPRSPSRSSPAARRPGPSLPGAPHPGAPTPPPLRARPTLAIVRSTARCSFSPSDR